MSELGIIWSSFSSFCNVFTWNHKRLLNYNEVVIFFFNFKKHVNRYAVERLRERENIDVTYVGKKKSQEGWGGGGVNGDFAVYTQHTYITYRTCVRTERPAGGE